MSSIPNINDKVVALDSVRKYTKGINDIQSIYESGFKNFFGYAYSLTHSRETSTDIVQTVFARMVAKVNRDNSIEVENIEAYIIRSIRNEHIDRKAKDFRRPALLSLVQDPAPSAENTHLESKENSSLQVAIKNLPTAQRTCLVMYYFNELKIEEIANEIGISISAVKTHLQRAKVNLGKSNLRESQGGDE